MQLPNSTNSCCGSEGTPEQVLGGAADIARARLLRLERRRLCDRSAPRDDTRRAAAAPSRTRRPHRPACRRTCRSSPTELVLEPGQTVKLRARLFDDKGRFLREDKATWSLEGLQGTVTDGGFTVAKKPVDQAGTIKATVGALSGTARARVVRSLPWTEDFESYMDKDAPPGWVNMVAGRFSITTLDGSKVLFKEPNDTLFKRIRIFVGPTNWSNYTFEASVRATERRRQLGDIGITAQRYSLVLYGNSQKLKIEPWEPETARTAAADFAWKADTWYRLKLRVENLANGQVRARGKAWPTGSPSRPPGRSRRPTRSATARAHRGCSSTPSSALTSTT